MLSRGVARAAGPPLRAFRLSSSHAAMQSQQQPDETGKPSSVATPSINAQYLEYMRNWNILYRPFVNVVIQDLLHTHHETRKKDISKNIWENMVNSHRRKMIKVPSEVFSKEELCNFCGDIERLRNYSSADEVVPLKELEAEIRSKYVQVFLENVNEEIDIHLGKDISLFHKLCNLSDLRLPHELYSRARMMKRKIIFHGGPTNSGKTYFALKRLEQADAAKGGGLYCGPLRLLALEVYEQLNRNGVYSDLLTGQEQRSIPFSSHVSCTIEMISLDKEYDVAVVDEIQMIADEHRGYAWTRALNGLRANEVHLCGGLEAADIVKSIALANQDDFELRTYSRLTPLQVSAQSLEGDYSKCQPGDCIVAFSKAEIFAIKKEVERLTPFKCAVIYGQLPPETRSQQARLFNEGAADILVASDAIGMGLNLNIRRTIFHSVVKRGIDAQDATWLSPSMVKQIAGRAGRLSSKFKEGLVTTWQECDLAYVKAVLDWEIAPITHAGLFPSVEQVQLFSDQLGVDAENTKLSFLMDKFIDLSQMNGKYFLCNHGDMVTVANWLHPIPLSLADKFTFCNAPVSIKDASAMNSLYYFAAMFALNRPVASNVRLPREPVKDMLEFNDLCVKHGMLDLYLWLSFRFPKVFIDRELSMRQRNHSLELIDKSMQLSASEGILDGAVLHKLYVKTKTGLKDSLPPESWTQVRKSTQEYLRKVPPSALHAFPNTGSS